MSSKACPACQAISAVDATFCARCGHRFQTQFAGAQVLAPRLYTLIADNGQQFGPVDLNGIRGWIASGMVNPLSRLQTNEGHFACARDFAELQPLFPTAGPQVAQIDLRKARAFALSPAGGWIVVGLACYLFYSGVSYSNSLQGQWEKALGGTPGAGSLIFGIIALLLGVAMLVHAYSLTTPVRSQAPLGLLPGQAKFLAILIGIVLLVVLITIVYGALQRA